MNLAKKIYWVLLPEPLSDQLCDYPSDLPQKALAENLRLNGFLLNVSDDPESVLEDASVFLFSSTSRDWPKVLELASSIRKKSSGVILIVGGYHVSALPHDQGTELFDHVVVGEGEEVLVEILKRYQEKGAVAFASQSKPIVHCAERITDLDSLPLPKRDPETVAVNRLRGLIYPPPSQQTGASSMLLSRGCNHRCSFCASHAIWGQNLILRNHDSVIEEYHDAVDRCGANAIVFVDQSFGEHPEWTEGLCRKLIAEDFSAKWYCMAKSSIGMELLPLMHKAGCTKIGFGVETASPERRLSLKRQNALEMDQLNALFRECNRNGIFVKAYLMIGFPWETKEYLRKDMKCFLENLEVNEIKLSYFTPFPGTDDWGKYKDQLLTNDWSDFDTESMPVVRNPNVSVDEYRVARQVLTQTFYQSGGYLCSKQLILNAHPKYLSCYEEFEEALREFPAAICPGKSVHVEYA